LDCKDSESELPVGEFIDNPEEFDSDPDVHFKFIPFALDSRFDLYNEVREKWIENSTRPLLFRYLVYELVYTCNLLCKNEILHITDFFLRLLVELNFKRCKKDNNKTRLFLENKRTELVNVILQFQDAIPEDVLDKLDTELKNPYREGHKMENFVPKEKLKFSYYTIKRTKSKKKNANSLNELLFGKEFSLYA
jgi:hypothetical protein